MLRKPPSRKPVADERPALNCAGGLAKDRLSGFLPVQRRQWDESRRRIATAFKGRQESGALFRDYRSPSSLGFPSSSSRARVVPRPPLSGSEVAIYPLAIRGRGLRLAGFASFAAFCWIRHPTSGCCCGVAFLFERVFSSLAGLGLFCSVTQHEWVGHCPLPCRAGVSVWAPGQMIRGGVAVSGRSRGGRLFSRQPASLPAFRAQAMRSFLNRLRSTNRNPKGLMAGWRFA